MSFCGVISQGSSYDCAEPVTPGIQPKVILINYDDIASVTYSGLVITDINFKSGKQAYLFEGIRKSIDARYEKKEAGFITGYSHLLDFQVYDISTAQKRNLEKLAIADLVAIVFNVNSPGNYDSFFEVFGIGAGLQAIGLTRINRDQETGASFSVNLGTSDTVIESKLPASFFDTDYQTTVTKILGYLNLGLGFPYTFPITL